MPAHRRPLRATCRRPAERCIEFQPAPCATIHVSAHRAPEGLARGARRDEPRSSFACPRLSTSPIQPCPSPLAYVAPHRSIEPGGVPPGAAAGATQRPRCARPGRHRCERSSHGARRVGLPFGPAHATSAVLPQGRSTGGACLRSRRSRVWRSARKPPQPRLAPLAPRRVRLRLAPSPRSRRRAILPLHSPSPRAQRRSDSAAILPLHPPCPRHVARRSPPAWKGSRSSRV